MFVLDLVGNGFLSNRSHVPSKIGQSVAIGQSVENGKTLGMTVLPRVKRMKTCHRWEAKCPRPGQTFQTAVLTAWVKNCRLMGCGTIFEGVDLVVGHLKPSCPEMNYSRSNPKKLFLYFVRHHYQIRELLFRNLLDVPMRLTSLCLPSHL